MTKFKGNKYLLLYCFSWAFVVHADHPCKSAIVLDDPSRSVLHNLPPSDDEDCDRALISGWYRLRINNTEADLSTSCLPIFRCGSSRPLWLNGVLPTNENEMKTESVCFRGIDDCCETSMRINIMNCGTYNIYNLTSLDTCMGRYCVASRDKCQAGYSSETGYEPNCQRINITFNEKPVVSYITPNHAVDQKYKMDHMLKFLCNVNIPESSKDYLFDVKWEKDGKQIIQTKQNIKGDNLLQEGQIKQTDWFSAAQQNMGFKLKCSIRARWSPYSIPTTFIDSDEFYAGIEVNTSTLVVNAGEPAYVQIRSTVPITCQTFPNNPERNSSTCSIRFEMLDYRAEEKLSSSPKEQFCQYPTATKFSACGILFDAWKWHDYQYLKIPTLAQQTTGDKIAIVKLRSVGISSDPLWKGYEIPDIKIHIGGTKNLNPASCSSVTDPHITTFDNKYFTTFENGEFILYQHKEKPIAVHVIHKSLGDVPRWNCAVAVRAASDTFIVYGCDRQWRNRRAFCDRIHGSYLDVYERNQGKEFEVHLPTGARVLINTFDYLTERYLNVQIFASTLDENKINGLCGNFNNNPNDDFTDTNGHVVDENTFKKSWHVKAEDSLFIAKARQGIIESSQYVCSCVQGEKSSKLDNTADCNWSDSVTVCASPSYSKQQCEFRHARETNENDMDIDISEDIVEFKPAPSDSGQWKNGWNESAATHQCTEVLHSSPVYAQCKDLVSFDEKTSIKMCVEDIQFLGNSKLVLQVIQPLRESCINMIRINTTLHSNETSASTATVISSVINNDCPHDCTQGDERRGLCKNGTCACFSPYAGDDCSVDTEKPPEIVMDEKDSKCDTSKIGCTYITFYGTNFFNSKSGLKCRFEEQQVSNNSKTTGKVHHINAELVSFGEIRCLLPPSNGRRRRDVTKDIPTMQPTSFIVSVTTNGNAFSNTIPVLVYDSACMNCNRVNEAFSCAQKDDICVVNGNCFEISNEHCSKQKRDSRNENFWIIGAVLGGISVLVVSILVVIKLTAKSKINIETSHQPFTDCMQHKPVYSKQ